MVTVAVFLFLLAVVCAIGIGFFTVLGRASRQLYDEGTDLVVAWCARMSMVFSLAGVAVLMISAISTASS